MGKMLPWIFAAFVLCKVVYVECGSNCYGLGQKHCQTQWDKLWEANYKKQTSNICMLFDDVHRCMLDFTKQCQFVPHEGELYKKDILATYTKDPYRCAVMGGNMQMRMDQGQEDRSSAQLSVAWTYTTQCLILLSTCIHVYVTAILTS